MSKKLPYMLATGLIPKILEKIQQAKRPDRFTQDFLSTKLGHGGGSAQAAIPLLKRMGFLASDGAPTTRYDQFRNVDTQGIAIAAGIKDAFSELFERNEYANDLPREKLLSLIVEITGAAPDDRTTKAIWQTFNALNDLADFEAAPKENVKTESTVEEEPASTKPSINLQLPPKDSATDGKKSSAENVDFKVSYTINLNLPETTNADVFNAIFKALKEHLLQG